ncbi:hypothetical protein FP435_01000 [Lactobacillus sp. PV037]|uniref:hypothetical protein n=1 Tax=Lactobacillus sp. PV037 TaxID=2594496 RepID=UPI0022404999|nr:hypothetical protein [Lactobacillus sp. PV037]QNQ83115.1 hypothetical protein FP435_01000 [Lactobacillus sp. PV037]
MKAYIVCPYNKSGGTRSLHQLGNRLVENGIDVYMYYGLKGKRDKVNKLLYADSNAKIATKIDDNKENILIVPESDTGWLDKFHNIRKVIWWLSLYFYLENNIWWRSKFRTKFFNQPNFFNYLRYVHIKLKEPAVSYIFPKELKNIDYHLYNCEYVHRYLLEQGIQKSKMTYLCGPIDVEAKDKKALSTVKENLIVYNPAKASPYFIKKVLKYMNKNYSSYIFKPLKGLNHEELLMYLKKAKVYLDLGYFPGPERIPREASVNYCNIITSTVGAAENSEDVPIPKKFKFDLKKENVSKICELIVDMCDNYDEYVHYFDKYRRKTLSQINNFNSDVDKFVKIMDLM